MSATSGTVSRPPRPTTSTGIPRASSAARSAGNWDRLRQSTAMSAARTPAAAGRPARAGRPGPCPAAGASSAADLRGDPGRLVRRGLQQGADHPPAPGPLRRRDQPRHLAAPPPAAPPGSGGGVQDPPGVAEAGGQQPDLRPACRACRARRPRPGGHREVGDEPAQVAGAGAAPAVDRLARVADGGDRVAAAEQRLQQHQLGVAGVLVLVEQHDLVAGPLGRADLGMAAAIRAASAIWSP